MKLSTWRQHVRLGGKLAASKAEKKDERFVLGGGGGGRVARLNKTSETPSADAGGETPTEGKEEIKKAI